MAAKFVNIDRDTPMLMPPDLRDWLPEDHMVHFILDVVQGMNFSVFSVNQRGTGSRQYPPSMLLALLVYCYCTGRFSSRVIEEATYCDVAVRYICAGTHPDHDTICTFRRVNREAFEKFFVHVLEVAAQSGVMKKVGTVSVDGTKMHANASKHSAVSYSWAQEMLKQLENEVTALTEKAEQSDCSQQEGCTLNLPDEVARRKERKARIEEAMAVIESRHEEKLALKRQEYEEKVARRQAQRDEGKKPKGREPKEPSSEVDKLRKQTVEPVFEIIKHCMRLRQFLMRGKEKVSGEWNLVCTAYNLKRTFNLIQAQTRETLSKAQTKTA